MREINRTGQDAKPDSPIGQIVEFAQDKSFEFETEAYTTATIAERELRFAFIGATMYLYTRKDDAIYRVALTAV